MRFGFAVLATFFHPQVISALANCLFKILHV
jgi:hypothetical protein